MNIQHSILHELGYRMTSGIVPPRYRDWVFSLSNGNISVTAVMAYREMIAMDAPTCIARIEVIENLLVRLALATEAKRRSRLR